MSSNKRFKISASKLKTFLDCRFKYYCKYILKLSEKFSPKAKLGSAIHEVFELLACPTKRGREKYILYSVKTDLLHPTIDRLFRKISKRHGVSSLIEDGRRLIVKSFIFGFEIKNVVAVEQHFSIPVSPHIEINGFIDKVQELDIKTLELSDYKSGQPMKDADCEVDVQPFFYLIAAETLYPGKEFCFTFHFLKNRKSYTILPKTAEQLKNFQNFVISQGMLMQSITIKAAKPHKSFKCKWCDYKEPRPDVGFEGCPAFSIFKNAN